MTGKKRQIIKKAPEKGGCQAAALPGIYYEKVYSKNKEIVILRYCSFYLSYDAIIWTENEFGMSAN